VSLEVGPGQIHGFLGPNGAGKTTSIRCIAGLLQPTSGRISINGHDLATEPEAAKASLGFIPDRPYIYEKLTAGEFLRFHGGLYAMDGPDVEATGLSAWTLAELCREVEERWGVSYHPSHMGKLMRQLDLSWQKARPSHPKADAAAREVFAKGGCRPPSTTRGRRTPTSA